MKTKIPIPFLAFWLLNSSLLLFVSCATIQKGSDAVVVNAERDTRLAADTFELLVKTEYEQRATLAAVNPQVAAQVKAAADRIRLHGKEWLQSARAITTQYKYHRTPNNTGQLQANLQTALATLSQAVTEAQGYLAKINGATTNPNTGP